MHTQSSPTQGEQLIGAFTRSQTHPRRRRLRARIRRDDLLQHQKQIEEAVLAVSAEHADTVVTDAQRAGNARCRVILAIAGRTWMTMQWGATGRAGGVYALRTVRETLGSSSAAI